MKTLENNSFNQFEQDLKNFHAQFSGGSSSKDKTFRKTNINTIEVTPVSQTTFSRRTTSRAKPFTVFTTPSPKRRTTSVMRRRTSPTTVPSTTTIAREENKNSNVIPVETTQRRNTKIKFTFNGVSDLFYKNVLKRKKSVTKS